MIASPDQLTIRPARADDLVSVAKIYI